MTTQIYFPTLANGPISWNWITLIGPDAQDFLHRLTTVNLRQMTVGSGAPGCFLTAQGRIRSYFNLWNPAQNQYAFEMDGGNSGKWKTDLLSIIDQYTFGEKITLEELTPSLKCAWIFPDEATLARLSQALPHLSPSETQYGFMTVGAPTNGTPLGIHICNHGQSTYGRPWLTVWGKPELLEQWISLHFPKLPMDLKTTSFAELESWRIQAVQPRVDSEITDAANPLEIGLRGAIADNKGCYPGQEVIEKIVALGSPAKRLVRIEGIGAPPKAGDRVQAIDPNTHQSGAEIGTVTTCIGIPNDPGTDIKFKALALIRKTHAQEGINVGFLNYPKMRGVVVKIAPHA
jgi:folate-binding protein YgfZ